MSKVTNEAVERAGPPYHFDRYINGMLMAEGITIEREQTFEAACKAAARLASKGPNGETPVLVANLCSPADHQATDPEGYIIVPEEPTEVDDGSLWVRPVEEFEDGRFEAMMKFAPSYMQPETMGDGPLSMSMFLNRADYEEALTLRTQEEALEKRVAELEAALRPFVKNLEMLSPKAQDCGRLCDWGQQFNGTPTVGQARAARAALEKKP